MTIAEKLLKIAEGQQKIYDAGVRAGKAEGGGSSTDLEALGALCDWSMVSNSESQPMMTIMNYHPSYYLICDIYAESVGGNGWSADVTVDPDSSTSITVPFAFNMDAFVEVNDVRWVQNP